MKLFRLIAIAVALMVERGSRQRPTAPNTFPRRILFIGGRDQPHLEAFKQGLRERGYVEGKTSLWSTVMPKEKNRLPELAAELVQVKVDVIVVTADIECSGGPTGDKDYYPSS